MKHSIPASFYYISAGIWYTMKIVSKMFGFDL